jgi:hypothetical protein
MASRLTAQYGRQPRVPANPGPDILNTSSLSIINTTNTTKTVTVAVSDADRLDDHVELV